AGTGWPHGYEVSPAIIINILGLDRDASRDSHRQSLRLIMAQQSITIDNDRSVRIQGRQIAFVVVRDEIEECSIDNTACGKREVLCLIAESSATVVSQEHGLAAQ